MGQAYDTDITDEPWETLELLSPPSKAVGRPRIVNMRDIISVLFYILSAGCAWRLLPHGLPPLANGVLIFSPMESRPDARD